MNTYPGAYWRPTDDNGSMPGAPDVTSLHIAVSSAEQSVYGWTSSAIACHAYNGKDGYFEQYVHWNRKVAGVADGNSHVTTVESYDGLHILQNPYREIGSGGIYGSNADDGQWDPGQCERAADMLAWQHLEYGLELRVMQTSRRSERGVAPHRLGVAPWRVSDGEVWTRHDGKRCPGDLRVQQIPAIVARASAIAAAVQAGRCTWLPPGAVDVPAALTRTTIGSPLPGTTPTAPATPTAPTVPQEDDMATNDEVLAEIRETNDLLRELLGVSKTELPNLRDVRTFTEGTRDAFTRLAAGRDVMKVRVLP